MFLTKDFQSINKELYTIVKANEFDIELASTLSGHYWTLRSYDNFIILFHKYPGNKTSHKQTQKPFYSLNSTIRYIINHDIYICSLKSNANAY